MVLLDRFKEGSIVIEISDKDKDLVEAFQDETGLKWRSGNDFAGLANELLKRNHIFWISYKEVPSKKGIGYWTFKPTTREIHTISEIFSEIDHKINNIDENEIMSIL